MYNIFYCSKSSELFFICSTCNLRCVFLYLLNLLKISILFYSLFFYATFLQVPDNFILGLFLLEELVFFFSLLNL